MNLSVVELVAYVVAGLLLASRVVNALKPVWAVLPRWAAVAIPVLVTTLPTLAEQVGLVQDTAGFVQVVVVGVAALVAGLVVAEQAPVDPTV